MGVEDKVQSRLAELRLPDSMIYAAPTDPPDKYTVRDLNRCFIYWINYNTRKLCMIGRNGLVKLSSGNMKFQSAICAISEITGE
jgi:hypothetical protein